MKEWNSLSGGEPERKNAIRKAMSLLLYKDRTEQELLCRLKEAGYGETARQEALAYVKSFGYINDRRYAENYVIGAMHEKSRRMMRHFLEEKGVPAEWIEEALASVPDREEEIILPLLRKKAGPPHHLEEKELRRCVAYLGRKGFSGSAVWHAVHQYQDESEEYAEGETDFL